MVRGKTKEMDGIFFFFLRSKCENSIEILKTVLNHWVCEIMF